MYDELWWVGRVVMGGRERKPLEMVSGSDGGVSLRPVIASESPLSCISVVLLSVGRGILA
jgi:hypothetical protein